MPTRVVERRAVARRVVARRVVARQVVDRLCRLTELDKVVWEAAEDAASLSPAWHAALASWPARRVRAAWAARADAPAELLAAAVADPSSRVRTAVVGNPRLPLAGALRVARSCAPYGPLAVATRPDCPDDVAADLIAGVGPLGGRARTWAALLRNRAAGLAGKPAAQEMVVLTCALLDESVPEVVIARLEEPVQTFHLARVLETTRDAAVVRDTVLWLPGSAEQADLVRRWLARVDEDDLRTPEQWSARFTELPFWCDPQPVTSEDTVWELRQVLWSMGRCARDAGRVEVACSATRWQDEMPAALADNPAVSDARLLEVFAGLGADRVAALTLGWLPARCRELAPRALEAMGASPEPPEPLEPRSMRPDALELVPRDAVRLPVALAEALEPLLGSAAWPVLDGFFADRVAQPVARLAVVACGVADVPVPAAIAAVADRLG